jgi:hypothetical protein
MGFLYNGGDCSQSYTVMGSDKFGCTDIGSGPPTQEGVESYIVVTALDDTSIVYHAGNVPVGSIYYLSDNGQRFVADQNITIYASEGGPMLQTLYYHSSCSQNLFLLDVFGASQLVEWINEEQGLVSVFANASFDLAITIPFTIVGTELTVTELFSITTFGVYNLTDEVYGMRLQPGSTITADFQVTIDLSTPQTYTFLTTIAGVTDLGVECRGVDFYNFTAGVPLNPGVPTVGPPGSAPVASKTGGKKRRLALL